MSIIVFDDTYFMRQALAEAQKAFDQGEIPIGAVVVWNNRIIGRGYNQTETLQDPTAHAEIIAITAATQNIGAKYLSEATLYVTIKPCIMCIGASYWAKIKRIVWGAPEPKAGFMQFESILHQYHKSLLYPKMEITSGVMADQARELMQEFFRLRRQ